MRVACFIACRRPSETTFAFHWRQQGVNENNLNSEGDLKNISHSSIYKHITYHNIFDKTGYIEYGKTVVTGGR